MVSMLKPGEGRGLNKNFNHVILCVYIYRVSYVIYKLRKVFWRFARFYFSLLEKITKKQKQKVFNFLTYLISLFDSLINSRDQTVTVVHQTSSEQCLVTMFDVITFSLNR